MRKFKRTFETNLARNITNDDKSWCRVRGKHKCRDKVGLLGNNIGNILL